jgi:predicted nucleic acid-binding protein
VIGSTWIQQRHPRRSSLVAALGTFLGSGEAEAIALAGERPHTLLLIDETHGRRVPRNMRIAIRGTLGILLQGFRAGSVADLEAAISRMRERGIWIADDLVATILAASRRR